MMRLIQYLVTPLYSGLRKIRDFSAENASYGAKTDGAPLAISSVFRSKLMHCQRLR
jgi:hypothetical protein